MDLDDIADMTEESEQAQNLSFQEETAVDIDGLASDAGESKSSNAVKAQIYQNNAPTENYVKPKKKRAIKGIGMNRNLFPRRYPKRWYPDWLRIFRYVP